MLNSDSDLNSCIILHNNVGHQMWSAVSPGHQRFLDKNDRKNTLMEIIFVHISGQMLQIHWADK